MSKPPKTMRDHTMWSLLHATASDDAAGREVLRMFERMGVQALPILERALATPSGGLGTRTASAWLLGRIGGERAVKALKQAASCADADVAGAARSALQRLRRRGVA